MSEVSVVSDTACKLGEGPVYIPEREVLYWFDILNCKRYALHMPTHSQTAVTLPEMASAMAVIDDHRDLILTETGLHIFDNSTGATTLVAAVEAENSSTRSNDARMHPSGAFWFGTMGKEAEQGAGAIYRYMNGEVDLLFDKITIPNAICFSPDGATAYFTDTRTDKWMKVAVDPDSGKPVADPDVFFTQGEEPGGIDGAIVDAGGNLWNARYGGSALDCYSPDGERIKTIEMPALQVTCPAFVGEGRIAVTSAWQNLDEEQRLEDNQAGQTFLVEVPVKPKYEARVKL